MASAPANVYAAFDMLLDEIQAEVETITGRVGPLAGAGDFEGARGLIDRSEKMAALKAKVAALREEWTGLVGRVGTISRRPAGEAPNHPKGKRLKVGSRVPTNSFRLPVLRALLDMGGSGPKAQVLARVHELIKDSLNAVDYEPIPSDPDRPRWRVRAEWVRFHLAEEGLIKLDSPRGIWEISDAGQEYMKQNSGRPGSGAVQWAVSPSGRGGTLEETH